MGSVLLEDLASFGLDDLWDAAEVCSLWNAGQKVSY
jgi:hypothetical protein